VTTGSHITVRRTHPSTVHIHASQSLVLARAPAAAPDRLTHRKASQQTCQWVTGWMNKCAVTWPAHGVAERIGMSDLPPSLSFWHSLTLSLSLCSRSHYGLTAGQIKVTRIGTRTTTAYAWTVPPAAGLRPTRLTMSSPAPASPIQRPARFVMSPPLIGGGHKAMMLSDVCLSRTLGLRREQRGLGRLKLA